MSLSSQWRNSRGSRAGVFGSQAQTSGTMLPHRDRRTTKPEARRPLRPSGYDGMGPSAALPLLDRWGASTSSWRLASGPMALVTRPSRVPPLAAGSQTPGPDRFAAHAGFSLIEAVTTLAIVSILAVGMVSVAANSLEMLQSEITEDRLVALQRAVSGDPVIVVNETRTAFGYVGDMGNLPANLQALWIKGAQPAFTFDTAKKTGAGWNGPYVRTEVVETLAALMEDGWGNELFYSNSPFTDATFGANALGKLASLGLNFSLGDDDDVTINFFESEIVSRIQGFVRDNKANVVPGVDITLNYPQSGVLGSQTATTDSLGYYFFADVPFGNRSLTIEPRLVLADGTAVVKGGNNDDVEFFVKNFAADDITITSITFDYSIDPPAYFDRLKVDGTTVYNDSTPRLGTGDTVNFSAETAKGRGGVEESIPIRLQSPITDVPDIEIGKIGKGSSLKIQMQNFVDVQSGGGGTAVDMSGVIFEVTFSDGSMVVVVPVEP